MARHKPTRHRCALLGLLEAWARWRLAGNGYPATSPLYRAGLMMPQSPNRPGSRPPGRVDARPEVLALHSMMDAIGRMDADKARAMEVVQAAWLARGKRNKDKAAALGLSVAVFHRRRELGLQLLESLLVWTLVRDAA